MATGACARFVTALAAPGDEGRAAAYWACHVVGRAAAGHAHNAAALADAGAVEAVCALADSRPLDVEVHLASVATLGHIAQSAALQQRIVSAGAVGRLLRVVETYESHFK